MDANRDEALRARELAEVALRSGDFPRAEKLLNRSLRLYHDSVTKSLLDKVIGNKCTAENRPSRHLRPQPPTSNRNDFTPEQVRRVKDVLSRITHYDVLEVSYTATDAEIKKAYRRLALALHPDKCKAPGAEEAFKRISKAFECLSVPLKRRDYDASGFDCRESYSQNNYPERRSPHHFSAAFYGTRASRFAERNHRTGSQDDIRTREALRLLPILIFLGVSILVNVLNTSSAPPSGFQFSPTRYFKHPLSTRAFDVRFYVPSDFSDTHPLGSTLRKQFEHRVEAVFLGKLLNDCKSEQTITRQRIQLARWSGNEAEIEKAVSATNPNCERLNDMMSRAPQEFQERLGIRSELR